MRFLGLAGTFRALNKIEMKLLGDIRFWIGLFFVIRFFGITNPPLEIGHNWRQTTVTMPARNFLEVDANILYPRIDIAGEKTGITGMEFPLLNYMIFLQAKIFGYAHWYGRLINLVVSSIGLFYFYKLIKKYFQPEVAFYATIILLFSIWFSYSRKIMPDTFSVSFMLAGIFYGSNYLDKGNKLKDLLLYAVLILIGILSKLPSAYIAVVFVFFLFDKQISNQVKVLFAATSAVVLSVVSTWYFYWVPYLVNTYGFSHFFMGESMLQGAKEIFSHLPETLKKFYAESLKYVGFAFFLAGIVTAIVKRDKKLLWVFSLSFLSFLLLVVFKSGFAFYHHIYYIIPFVPVMALVAAYAISQIKNKKNGIVALSLIGVEGLVNQYPDFTIKSNYAAILNLEADMDKISDRKDLILINSGDYPTPMYFAHRKGWVTADARIGDTSYVNELKGKGLKFIVILKKAFGENMPMRMSPVLSNEDYDIYKLWN